MGVKRRSCRRAIAMTDAAGRCVVVPTQSTGIAERTERKNMAEDKTLRDVPVGQSATVRRLVGEGAIKRRIMDMASPRAPISTCARWRLWETPSR